MAVGIGFQGGWSLAPRRLAQAGDEKIYLFVNNHV
jgi:hypothetical protein